MFVCSSFVDSCCAFVNLQGAWLDSSILLPWQQEVHQHPTEVSTQVHKNIPCLSGVTHQPHHLPYQTHTDHPYQPHTDHPTVCTRHLTVQGPVPEEGGRGVLPYTSRIGTRRPKGYHFYAFLVCGRVKILPFWSEIGCTFSLFGPSCHFSNNVLP